MRQKWEFAFVRAKDFDDKAEATLADIGIKAEKVPGLDMTDVPGVLCQQSPDWPEEIPFSIVEIYAEKDFSKWDIVHDKSNLHPEHGQNIFNDLTRL